VKKIILILIFIGAVVTAGSFQVGRVIEAELPKILDRVADLGQMQISITDYDRQLFRSTVKTTISLASVGGTIEQIHLRHNIWHGPFPIGKSSDGEFHYAPMSALVETMVDHDNPPSGLIGNLFENCPELYDSIELARFDFAGNGTSTYHIPGFAKTFGSGKNELAFEWQGLTGQATIDKSIKKINGETVIPKIRISSETGRVETEKIHSTYRIFEDFGGLLLGNITLDTEAISISSGRSRTELSDFQFRNSASLNNENVSYSIAIGIEKINSTGQIYGPLGLELDFAGLDAATILEVQKKLQTIQSHVASVSEEKIAAEVFAIYTEALPELIKKSPEIRLNYLNMSSPNGEFWSKGKVVFENQPGARINSINDLLGAILANTDIQISKPLLLNLFSSSIKGQMHSAREAGQLGDVDDEKFEKMTAEAATEQIEKLVRQGALVDEGKSYRALFEFKNRKMTLNGQPFSVTK